jgi:hypothetical protein
MDDVIRSPGLFLRVDELWNMNDRQYHMECTDGDGRAISDYRDIVYQTQVLPHTYQTQIFTEDTERSQLPVSHNT